MGAPVRLCYFIWKGDLKARKQVHAFAKHYGCRAMCERCDAIRPASNSGREVMSYKNFGLHPPYEATVLSHEGYVRSAQQLSPWLCVEGFSLHTVSYDVLHVLYLGTARDHVASMLKYLRLRGYHYVDGEREDAYLRRISLEMRHDCKQHGRLGFSGFRFNFCLSLGSIFHATCSLSATRRVSGTASTANWARASRDTTSRYFAGGFTIKFMKFPNRQCLGDSAYKLPS